MFSFGRREDSSQKVSPEKSTSNHAAYYGNHHRGATSGYVSSSTGGAAAAAAAASPSLSISPATKSSSPHNNQQRNKRGSVGGGGGFSPTSIGRSGGGKKLMGGRRFGGNGGGTSNKTNAGRGTPRGNNRNAGKPRKDMNLDVNESDGGIEVSFLHPQDGQGTPQSATGTPRPTTNTPQHASQQDEPREPAPTVVVREPVISLRDQLRHRQRVWRTQFSVAFPALQQNNGGQDGLKPSRSGGSVGQGSDSITAKIAASNGMTSWRPKGHRLPLVGVSVTEPAYIDALHLLQSSRASDEQTAIRDELKHMDSEIAALEKDRKILERHVKHEQRQDQQFGSALTAAMSPFSFLQTGGSNVSNGSSINSVSDGNPSATEFDAHKLLRDDAHARHLLLTHKERTFLQYERGNSMTIRLDNPRTKEMFIHRCGGKLHQVQRNRLFKGVESIITLHPGNCRSASQPSLPSGGPTPSSDLFAHGAAIDLQHVELIASTGSYNGFFLSRDGNKPQTWGRIPNKLYRRMKQEGAGAAGGGGGAGIGDLVYLSTGPHGSYYAEFQSGECWWGSAVIDDDFHNLIRAWDVYRVAFGSVESVSEDENDSKQISTCSWIIIGRDGRVAWKNLPSRLANKLDGRLANWAAPAEVSLGPGDSYFVRFLDGSVDYCLPSEIARVCDRIQSKGGRITSISLHPEISNDFVIRHTDLIR